jgi:hypothetical protein
VLTSQIKEDTGFRSTVTSTPSRNESRSAAWGGWIQTISVAQIWGGLVTQGRQSASTREIIVRPASELPPIREVTAVDCLRHLDGVNPPGVLPAPGNQPRFMEH